VSHIGAASFNDICVDFIYHIYFISFQNVKMLLKASVHSLFYGNKILGLKNDRAKLASLPSFHRVSDVHNLPRHISTVTALLFMPDECTRANLLVVNNQLFDTADVLTRRRQHQTTNRTTGPNNDNAPVRSNENERGSQSTKQSQYVA
jgi:hypothetical protein